MYRRHVGSSTAARRRRPPAPRVDGFPLDRLSAGSVVLEQGVVAGNVFVLRSGMCELVHRLSDGRRTVIGLRGRGTIVGAESALARQPQPVGVLAVTACSALRIPASRFASLLREPGRFAEWVLAAQFQELESQVMQSVGLARFSARERLESFLEFVRLESERGEPRSSEPLALPLRDRELAQLIAVTPSYLSRLMREMQRQGRVVREGRRTRYVQEARRQA